MGEVLLSACMIVRNEEEFLEGALLSLESITDEIVVVDTGSTDHTLEICADHGVRLHHFSWNEDFSAPRNEAIKRAKGKWILTLDADERLRPCCNSTLKALLKDNSGIALYALLHPRTGSTGSRVLRLFRNDPRIRYQGYMHESIRDAVHRILASEGGEIGESGLILDHLGYDGDQSRKHLRNLPLLLKELQRDPGDTNNWRHLALVYFELGEDSLAEETWSSIIESLRRKDKLQPVDSVPYIDWIRLKLERGEDAGSLLEEAMSLFPENPELYWLQGREKMVRNRYEEALPFFERLAQWGEKNDFDRSISYNTNIFHVYAYDSLATCCFRLGRYTESKRYFEIAQRYSPEQVEYKIKAVLCSSLEMAGSNRSRQGGAHSLLNYRQ